MILCTTDGGSSWTSQNTKTSENLNTLIFKDKNTGIAAGENGVVRLTTIGTISNSGNDVFSSVMFKDNDINIPNKFALGQNYPNPFNPVTEINYNLGQDCNVTIKVYTSLGEEISILVNNELQSTGEHRIKFDGTNLPSGIYFYRIYAGSFSDTKKMVLLK